jgi:hypothetical protein
MRRFQVASLLTLVLALTGGFAAPSRPAEASRLMVSIAWFEATPSKPPARRHAFQLPHIGRAHVTSPLFVVHAPVHRSALVTHSLFQRPPPESRRLL